MKYIKKENCKHRYLYRIHSRNLYYGVFNEEDAGFIGIREKFNNKYLFKEMHYDNGPPFGTVKPEKEIEKIPDNIILNEHKVDKKTGSDNWVKKDGEWKLVIRRDRGIGEPLHGGRKGFVDEWVDTGERLPDDLFPVLRINKKLFNYLEPFDTKIREKRKKEWEEYKKNIKEE